MAPDRSVSPPSLTNFSVDFPRFAPFRFANFVAIETSPVVSIAPCEVSWRFAELRSMLPPSVLLRAALMTSGLWLMSAIAPPVEISPEIVMPPPSSSVPKFSTDTEPLPFVIPRMSRGPKGC